LVSEWAAEIGWSYSALRSKCARGRANGISDADSIADELAHPAKRHRKPDEKKAFRALALCKCGWKRRRYLACVIDGNPVQFATSIEIPKRAVQRSP
jgi:hypothetical protein